MRSAKDRKLLIWSLSLGLPLLLFGSVHHQRLAAEAQLPGPKPGAMLMTLAVGEALRKHLGDPDSLEDRDVYAPIADHLDSLACWRYPIVYRTRTPSGGLILHRGAFWVRDGRVLRAQWD
jgi:hypothetical protein